MRSFFNLRSLRDRRRHLRKNMPFAEVLLWNRLKGRQLLGYKFRRQHGVDRYVLDFYCPALKLGVEVDGESHCQPESRGYDSEREALIKSLGITIVRIPAPEIIESIDGVMEMLAAEIGRIGRGGADAR